MNEKNETVGNILICITIDEIDKDKEKEKEKSVLINGSDENIDEGIEG